MSSNFYDLLKYANTGIASPEMTHFDKMRALSMAGGGKVETLTGVPPLSFRANGKPLISLSMIGNAQQSGTQTPEFVGVRTANLCDLQYINGSLATIYRISSSNTGKVYFVPCEPKMVYTLSGIMNEGSEMFRVGLSDFDAIEVGQAYKRIRSSVPESGSFTFTTEENTKMIVFQTGLLTNTIMLNTGSTPLPYEPYGWKIPVTCGGQTTPIYIGDLLRKALDGSGAVDVLSSTGIITREVDADGNALIVPVTQAVDVPEILTAKGNNVLTTETELQPSSMTITYTR